jgi:hypothetical protein
LNKMALSVEHRPLERTPVCESLPTMREKNFFGNAPIARRPNLFDRFVAHPGRVLKPTSSRTILTLP